ncbi:MAG: 2-oxoglutarate dehydrogenase complex dihydrolipoyllysine-residue succinyltransferase [Hyphomicrobium sp.]
MTVEIKVPVLGESITEATVGRWFKKEGESVKADEPLVELETDKVTVEVPAPASGVLTSISADKGDTVAIGASLGALKESGARLESIKPQKTEITAAPSSAKQGTKPQKESVAKPAKIQTSTPPPAPSARKILAEAGISPEDVQGTGRNGQILKEDALQATAEPTTKPSSSSRATEHIERASSSMPVVVHEIRVPTSIGEPAREERVKMTRLRQTIARRLKDAQNAAAMLTTFNDVDMSAVMGLRTQYKDLFEKRHGVKLGFMAFFVKACVQALREIPSVNAEIDGDDIIYKNYYHIGVAVGSERGLVVPVLREADRMSLAEIEITIANFSRRAREGKLTIEDMQGGTFTISNGGVYGSMLSTPILNAPQSGILGMHRIEERAVVREGQIVIRPIMYLALSYDHRIVDGKEAVTFLVRVKECLEDPQRFILEL